ncbi:hypothetical protein BGZ67_001821 [Mortierella alpina]|nr:hypothetical protein BGZ67_001821 [Mortierella alpina]
MAPTAVKPKVIIVGAGIGGLVLAILLEQAGVPYEILERATVVRPLGSALALGVNVMPFFKQAGLYDEIMGIGKVFNELVVFNENREPVIQRDLRSEVEMGGSFGIIVARPKLYDIFLRHVPAAKILRGKRVESIEEFEGGVRVACKDGSIHEGHILVGADGAYSTVRKCLYKRLKDENKLPAGDDQELPFNFSCIVGQTVPLDPKKFTQLNDALAHSHAVIGDNKPYSWSTITTKDDTICWTVIRELEDSMKKDVRSRIRNPEQASEATEEMCTETRDFPLPLKIDRWTGDAVNLTLGDLYDNTPRDLVSIVTLEEKVFETWYAGRTVLMGDAVHKMNPAGGQGAVTAMHDAIILANWINAIPSTSVQDIEMAFREYKDERFLNAVASFKSCQGAGKILEKVLY